MNLKSTHPITGRAFARRTLVLTATAFAFFAVPVCLSATETLVSSGENIDWFGYRSNSKNTFFTYDAETKTTKMTNLDSDSYVFGYFPQGIELAVGEKLTVRGTATFSTVASNSAFFVGFYNSGENAKPAAGTTFTGIVDATGTMTGFFGGTKTSKSTGSETTSTTATVYSRFKGKPATESEKGAGFMTTNQGKNYITVAELSGETSVAHPTAGTACDFLFSISRTESGYTVALGDENNTATFSSGSVLSAENFDVIGIKSAGSGLTLSNFSISTTGSLVPEPATFGVFSGMLALAIVASRRRRRTREIR